MALINRVTRLFKADIHAVLDQIEEPEQLLRQAVRDMEEELRAADQRVVRLRREQDALGARINEVAASVGDADEQLDICFRSGKDKLAKGLIRRRLEAERVLGRLQSRFESISTQLESERRQLDENRIVLDGLRQKADVLASTSDHSLPDFDDGGWLARDIDVSEEEVEIAFLREKEARQTS